MNVPKFQHHCGFKFDMCDLVTWLITSFHLTKNYLVIVFPLKPSIMLIGWKWLMLTTCHSCIVHFFRQETTQNTSQRKNRNLRGLSNFINTYLGRSIVGPRPSFGETLVSFGPLLDFDTMVEEWKPRKRWDHGSHLFCGLCGPSKGSSRVFLMGLWNVGPWGFPMIRLYCKYL